MLQRLRKRAQCKLAFKLPNAANLLQRYVFLLKEARIFGKMFEGEGDFTDVHLVKGKQTCYEGNFFDNTSSSSFTVSGASLDDSGFSKQF